MQSDVKPIIRDHWNGRAALFDSFPHHSIASADERTEWIRMLSSFIGQQRIKVLDVGTGTGEIALLLAELGHQVTGIDLAKNMLSEARTKAVARNLEITFVSGDAEELPFDDSTFDVVVNRNLVWTLPHPEQALAEWKRVLCPGGKLVVIDGDWKVTTSLYRKGIIWLNSLLGKNRPPSLDVYKKHKIVDALPLQHQSRPDTDLKMLHALGFSTEAKGIGRGKDFFHTAAYGKNKSYNRFVLYAQKPYLLE
jgi:ubiquinone/menaquinone biosynthesis C-methylase UbiE